MSPACGRPQAPPGGSDQQHSGFQRPKLDIEKFKVVHVDRLCRRHGAEGQGQWRRQPERKK